MRCDFFDIFKLCADAIFSFLGYYNSSMYLKCKEFAYIYVAELLFSAAAATFMSSVSSIRQSPPALSLQAILVARKISIIFICSSILLNMFPRHFFSLKKYKKALMSAIYC